MNDHPNRHYRIFALDDHPVVTAGICHLLGDYTIAAANEAQQMIDLLRQGETFDLFILDLELPDADGFEALKMIRHHCPDCAILIYTMHEEPWIIARLASLDIQGVVSKSQPVTRLSEAVGAICRGNTFFDDNIARQFQTLTATDSKPAYIPGHAFQLSERELQVLRCMADGLSTSEIAERLFISVNTVGTYRRRLMVKFDTHNAVQLVSKARKYLE